MAAATLARAGVRKLTLVDPDAVEPHNLGEMDAVGRDDIGRPKVTAVAAALMRELDIEVEALTIGIDRLSAFRAARSADMLIGCADNPVARLLTSTIGVAYLRPVIDIGAGVFGSGVERRMGLDVRLLLPGVCLVCLGGVVGLRLDALGEHDARAPRAGADEWRRERAGSLRSLNQIAVGLGVRLLEDLISGRVSGSAWLRVEFDGDGAPRLLRIRPSESACPLCAVAGCGDGVLPLVPRLLRQASDFMTHQGSLLNVRQRT